MSKKEAQVETCAINKLLVGKPFELVFYHSVPEMKLHFWDGYNSKSKYSKKFNNMKPGDKVWVFNSITQTIVDYTVDGFECNRETEGLIHVFTEDDHIIGYYLGVNCFPTREALCEHYRKIFE